MKKILDARGLACPIPVVKAIQTLSDMTEGVLEVHVDNAAAVENLKRMAEGKNLSAESVQLEEQHFVVTIPVDGPVAMDDTPPLECDIPASPRSDYLVAVDTATMGRGSEELGGVLMKGFLFALTQMEQLPATILFYNGGVKLTTEGSDSLEDLRQLEQRGVEILSCGTCLNYYGLTEKLAVGGVTNMYAIVEKLTRAGRVIKP
jgi:selenium metabolism protein YedF